MHGYRKSVNTSVKEHYATAHNVPVNMHEAMGEIRGRLGGLVLARVYEVLAARVDELAVELTDLYQTRIPVYERFDSKVIQANTRLVLEMVFDQLRESSQEFSTVTLTDMSRTLHEQGIPLEPVAHSIQLGSRRISAIVREQASELGIAAGDLAAIQDLTWEWAIEASSIVQSVQQELAIVGATRRADFLRQLVAGTLAPARLSTESPTHQLVLGQNYHVACTWATESRSGSDLLGALRLTGGLRKAQVVDAVVDGLVVALLPRLPDVRSQRHAVGIGPAMAVAQAAESFDQARWALDIAERHGRTGLIDLSSLGPLPLLDCAATAADALDAKYLEPLRSRGASGAEVLNTVVAYLARDRRIEDTAAELHVHRNTVRYRLDRFNKLTGLDLDRTDDLVIAWWLLGRPRG